MDSSKSSSLFDRCPVRRPSERRLKRSKLPTAPAAWRRLPASASLLPSSTRVRVLFAPPRRTPNFSPHCFTTHFVVLTGLLSFVIRTSVFSSVLSYKPSQSFGHGSFSSLIARLAQRLVCARAQEVALLGGYSVYSGSVPVVSSFGPSNARSLVFLLFVLLSSSLLRTSSS